MYFGVGLVSETTRLYAPPPRVGATDESHFVRDFKKTYGLTPAKYRERFLRGRRAQVLRSRGGQGGVIREAVANVLEQLHRAGHDARQIGVSVAVEVASHQRSPTKRNRQSRKFSLVKSNLFLRMEIIET